MSGPKARRLVAVLASATVVPSLAGGPASHASPEISVYTAGYDSTLPTAEVDKLDPTGERLWRFNGGGIGDDVEVDPDGYVHAVVANSVVKFDPNGEVVWSYPGNLDEFVTTVTVDADGFAYAGVEREEGVTTTCDVRKLDPNGSLVFSTSTPCVPNALAIDGDGNVYSAGSRQIVKYTQDGEVAWRYGEHDGIVRGVAVDPEGMVYSASWDDEVHKIDPDGQRVWAYTGHSDSVFDVAVDSEGDIYTAAADFEVHKLSPEGERYWAYTGHHTGRVVQVAVDEHGNAYTASQDDEVHKIDADGNHLWAYTGHTSAVRAVAVDPGAYTVAGHDRGR
ncbi:PQQ-binding-like beta-propeller repeat protein [Haloechinothrix sp. LS1_15]|uniref:SMP-30/gluconolactonase/LRE family protein n=1 Tax=Haloechinothrix sp. LS1_15 TaxID=2652248 RepID=UPI0029442D79|nr:SMP-30/gluconolactonase/LRE family protein [Haloechinothrix sp. LS1_15]MDV6012214.1 PQQ-binding-like beta-propeller repeat protein [Haloechinothrix sp. LS1_15]